MPTASLLMGKITPLTNGSSEYDTKLSDCRAPILELWEMLSTSLFPLIPDPV